MAGKEDQIKTEIAVDGEQEYKKACKEIDASLKAIASEMKVVSATFEGNADSIEAMTAKQDVLNKRLEEQKKKVAEAEAALKTLKRKLSPSTFSELVAAAPQLPTWLARSVGKAAHG